VLEEIELLVARSHDKVVAFGCAGGTLLPKGGFIKMTSNRWLPGGSPMESPSVMSGST